MPEDASADGRPQRWLVGENLNWSKVDLMAPGLISILGRLKEQCAVKNKSSSDESNMREQTIGREDQGALEGKSSIDKTKVRLRSEAWSC